MEDGLESSLVSSFIGVLQMIHEDKALDHVDNIHIVWPRLAVVDEGRWA